MVTFPDLACRYTSASTGNNNKMGKTSYLQKDVLSILHPYAGRLLSIAHREIILSSSFTQSWCIEHRALLCTSLRGHFSSWIAPEYPRRAWHFPPARGWLILGEWPNQWGGIALRCENINHVELRKRKAFHPRNWFRVNYPL